MKNPPRNVAKYPCNRIHWTDLDRKNESHIARVGLSVFPYQVSNVPRGTILANNPPGDAAQCPYDRIHWTHGQGSIEPYSVSELVDINYL